MNADLANEAAQLIDRLERLSRLGEGAFDLNPAQWAALRYLSRANRFSRTPAALADYLGSTRGTVSQTLIALEGKGLVSRAASERDRRSVALELTLEGQKVLAKDPLLQLVQDIKAQGKADLTTLVDTLRDILRRAVVRNNKKPFGACHSCRHFREGSSDHHCALLDLPLSAEDSAAICAEHLPTQ